MHAQGDFSGDLPLHHFLCLYLPKHPESSVHSCCYKIYFISGFGFTLSQALGLE